MFYNSLSCNDTKRANWQVYVLGIPCIILSASIKETWFFCHSHSIDMGYYWINRRISWQISKNMIQQKAEEIRALL